MRRWKIAVGLALAAGAALGLAAARAVGQRLEREVEGAARAAGVSIGRVHVWPGSLRLEDVAFRPDARTSVTIDSLSVEWRPRLRRNPRAYVSALSCSGLAVRRGPLAIELPAERFHVRAWEARDSEERLRLQNATDGGWLDARWSLGPGQRRARLELADLDISRARVVWEGETVLEPGRWTGQVALHSHGDQADSTGELTLRAARVALSHALGGDEAAPGQPTDIAVAWSARRDRDVLEVERATARLAGLSVETHGRISGGAAQRHVEGELTAEAELGAALRTAGLRLPDVFAASRSSPLGTARLEVSLRGPLHDRAVLRVVPRLRFEPAPASVEAMQFLRRPFRHVPWQTAGMRIEVSAGAADFVPLEAVPPLFVRLLLLSEDAGFFGHPGVDVAEIPVAWAANAEKGGFARGASTITQQLARNLFLSREKSYARKLEEAALALMMDGAVPKARVLEIYLNVIEWGPGLFGLGPAARHYFGKDASQLTAKEMVFLICLIPSPVRYHSAHSAGHVGPGMDELMLNLLARAYEAGAVGEEECLRASEEELAFAPEDGAAARTEG